jgi:hypothetical protein
MKNYLLLLAVAATVGFTSCGKDDDSANPTKSKTDLISASGWKLSSLTISPAIDLNGDGTPDSDLTPFVSACNKDDVTIFKSDKTYTMDEGATKCSATDPQVFENGTWAFSADESKITLTPTGSPDADTYTITELNENTLKYTETQSDSSGTYTFTATFNH